MESKDLIRLKHMRDSTEAILSFAKGRQRAALNKDRLFQSAVLRELEIIGEAAGQVSEKTKKKFSTIPWKELVGLRNRLIHAYFDVDLDIVWKTIREYLPPFLKELQQAVGALEYASH